MPDKAYIITHTQGQVYLNNAGKAVNGFRVDFTITEFGEGMAIEVDSLNPQTVKAAIEKVIEQRKGLAALG